MANLSTPSEDGESRVPSSACAGPASRCCRRPFEDGESRVPSGACAGPASRCCRRPFEDGESRVPSSACAGPASRCCRQQQLRTPAEFDEGARYNIFRDSPLRYMGYCNEIGESFRYQFPRFVVPSYILSFGYVGADALTTGYREYCSEDKDTTSTSSSREYRAGLATFDTLLWQSLASVMIPGLAINLVVKASRFAVARSPVSIPAIASKWLPTAAGIGSIPLIIHPIDSFVDLTLDNSTRVWLAENTSDGNNEGDDAKSQ